MAADLVVISLFVALALCIVIANAGRTRETPP